MGLIDDALAGSRRALARLASLVERDDEQATAIMARVYPRSGRAATIGLTGPPGAGKSSLINRLIAEHRRRGQTIAVIAVDPSSPVSGGATLGDRIRMLDRFDDPGVFIRSMASRGKLGGLATTTPAMIHLVDAAGFDVVIVETVGVGQEEIDITHYVDTTVVVQTPGFGDAIQALKAGILEIADIYAVNKADLAGADATAKELRSMLALGRGHDDAPSWRAPVIKVSALSDTGVIDLTDAIERHRRWLAASGEFDRRRRSSARFETSARLERAVKAMIESGNSVSEEIVAQVARRTMTPDDAARRLVTCLAADQQPD